MVALLQQALPDGRVRDSLQIVREARVGNAKAGGDTAQHGRFEGRKGRGRVLRVEWLEIHALRELLERARRYIHLDAPFRVRSIADVVITRRRGEKPHFRGGDASGHQLGFLIATQHLQPGHCRGHPRIAAGLAGAKLAVSVDDLLGRDALALDTVAGRELVVVGVLLVDVVGDRLAALIDFDAHPDFVTVPGGAVVFNVDSVGVDELKPEAPRVRIIRDLQDEAFAVSCHGFDEHPLGVQPSHLAVHGADAQLAPSLEGFLEDAIRRLVERTALVTRPNLQLDTASADHVRRSHIEESAGIVVVNGQLTRASANGLQRVPKFVVRALGLRQPVRKKPPSGGGFK